MLPKFSVKNDIKAQHYVTVKLNKFGEKKEDNYGGHTYWGNAHVDGVEHMWFISENMHKGITEAGFGEGDTFCVLKWKAGQKMGYNYLDPQDIAIKNATPMKVMEQAYQDVGSGKGATHEVKIEPGSSSRSMKWKSYEPPVDTLQERISRGAAWNNAFMWLCHAHTKPNDIEDFCKRTAELAEEIAKHQSKFVSGE